MDHATHIVHSLLEEWEALLEDRIDDLIRQYPDLRWERSDIDKFARYDPSRNKKYLPWLVKQIAQHKLEMDAAELDSIHDDLMEFERVVAIPAWQGNRDIQGYDYRQLHAEMEEAARVRSQSELERKAKHAKKTKTVADYEHKEGVDEVGHHNDLSLLKITNAESLSWWAWRGYMEENPNWGRPTIQPPPPGQEVSIADGKWCVRKTTHGLNYLRREPFYLVLKKGWPYAGILIDQGQVKTLDNDQVSMGMAEEIYPLLKSILDKFKADGGSLHSESRIFENMRFLQNGVQAGETFNSDVDLSDSSLASMPEGLTFNDSLDIDNTPMTEIPPNTTVRNHLWARNTKITKIGPGLSVGDKLVLSGSPVTSLPVDAKYSSLDISGCPISELPDGLTLQTLNIVGTPITKLPLTLTVEKSMTWSEPLTLEECKMLFLRINMDKLKHEFYAHPKFSGLSKVALDRKWKSQMPALRDYYLTSPTIDGHVKSVFVKKDPSKIGEAMDMKARMAAMRHRKTDTIGVGSHHSEAMEDLVRKMCRLGYWNIGFDEIEQLPNPQRNRYYRGIDIGFTNAAGKFFTREQSIRAGGVTHGEEIK